MSIMKKRRRTKWTKKALSKLDSDEKDRIIEEEKKKLEREIAETTHIDDFF